MTDGLRTLGSLYVQVEMDNAPHILYIQLLFARYNMHSSAWVFLLTVFASSSNPLQYSCLENAGDRGAWWATVHGVAQSRTRLKQLSMHACIGEGNGNPLQCSCLENLWDSGAWWAAVYRVAQGRTQLKRLSSGNRSFPYIPLPLKTHPFRVFLWWSDLHTSPPWLNLSKSTQPSKLSYLWVSVALCLNSSLSAISSS